MSRLGRLERGVGERGSGDRRRGGPQPELAAEQVGRDDRQRPREDEEQVVTDERRGGARADESGRRVAEQRVGEREAVRVRPERIRLEQMQRMLEQLVTLDGDLPRGANRVTQVGIDPRGEVQRKRPTRDDRQQQRADDEQRDLAAAKRGDDAAFSSDPCSGAAPGRAARRRARVGAGAAGAVAADAAADAGARAGALRGSLNAGSRTYGRH